MHPWGKVMTMGETEGIRLVSLCDRNSRPAEIHALILHNEIPQRLPFMACSLNQNHMSPAQKVTVFLHEVLWCTKSRKDQAIILCYLVFFISVADWGLTADLTKSLVITSSSPSRRTQRWTTRRIFCNRRSKAKRWGSIRIGLKGSPSRDSLNTSLSLYSGRAKSWSRSSVERFILKSEHNSYHFGLR